jgi:hypothetical protein
LTPLWAGKVAQGVLHGSLPAPALVFLLANPVKKYVETVVVGFNGSKQCAAVVLTRVSTVVKQQLHQRSVVSSRGGQ